MKQNLLDALKSNVDRILRLQQMALVNITNNTWEYEQIAVCQSNIDLLETMIKAHDVILPPLSNK